MLILSCRFLACGQLCSNVQHSVSQTTFYIGGLPLITYAPRGRGGQVSYTFLLRITCKKGGGEGVQITCKNAYVINGRPFVYCIWLSSPGPLSLRRVTTGAWFTRSRPVSVTPTTSPCNRACSRIKSAGISFTLRNFLS